MRRTGLFLARFAIALWIVLISAFTFLLVFESPSLPNTPFASVSIQAGNDSSIRLPNRIFTCTETDSQFQCQTEIENRPLDLTWTKGSNYKYELSNCQAIYAGQAFGCEMTGGDFVRGWQFHYTITSNLGLSSQQLQALKQEFWGINALMRVGEVRLFWLSTGLSIAAGITAAFLAWMHPGNLSKAFASFVCGYGTYRLVDRRLGRVPFDLVTPYGIVPDTWMLMVQTISIAVGIGASLVVAIVLWRQCNGFTKALGSLSTSIGVFTLCSLSLIWNFSYLGSFLTASGLKLLVLEDGRLLMSVATIISILPAAVAGFLLWRHTKPSIKGFLCLSNSFGAFVLATQFFLSLLLGLGYAD